jgi:GNAT superfamily N-acetyltransferase
MFHVKNMSPKDFDFAIQITGQMNWHLAKEDFEFMMELEPKGCFVLLDISEKIGIATTISFGKVGWFGNLIVSESRRKRGAGSLLVNHALKYLKSRNVETVGLYAYVDKIPFYRRLGFEYDSDFIVLNGKGFPSSVGADLKKAEKEDIQKIIDYDNLCFGASRRKLLEPILLDPDNSCYFSIEKDQISGYAVAKVYKGGAELGPLVCPKGRNDIAIKLLRTILNKLHRLEVSMCVPQKENLILKMLMESGFSENFRVARMFFGPPIVKDCIYVAESLERG